MADVKTIQTRLQLKYDTYANWADESKAGIGGNLVLLAGEVGICAIGNTDETGKAQATTNPTVLFKVGDGVTPFKSLKWASALAADVYAWAKSETVAFNATNKHVEFKTGGTVNHFVDLSDFAEASTVADHGTRLTDIEAALGLEGGDGKESISAQITDIVERLGTIQGADTVEGSIAKALKDAKAYTDEVVGTKAEGETAATGLRKEIADAQAAAEAAAKTYTDGEVDKLEAKDADLSSKIDENTTAIENVRDALNTFESTLGFINVSDDKTVAEVIDEAIKAAQDAADAAQADVDALTAADGVVTKNTADIAQLTADLGTETIERKAADEALDNRLKEVEAFFEGAKEDSEGLNDALDKLVDIQTYLTGDGSAAGDLVGQVSANAEAITALQDIVKDGGTLEVRVDNVEASTSANAGNITNLQNIVEGYTEKGSVKTAIEAAKTQADKGVEDAGKAQAAADKAQGDIDALALVINNETTGLAATKGIADKAAADVAALEPRVQTAEEAITNITKADGLIATAKQEAIDAAATDASNKVVVALSEAQAYADGLNTAMDARVQPLESDVAAIKGDYLKAADVYVFSCGSSTTVTHIAPAAN